MVLRIPTSLHVLQQYTHISKFLWYSSHFVQTYCLEIPSCKLKQRDHNWGSKAGEVHHSIVAWNQIYFKIFNRKSLFQIKIITFIIIRRYLSNIALKLLKVLLSFACINNRQNFSDIKTIFLYERNKLSTLSAKL